MIFNVLLYPNLFFFLETHFNEFEVAIFFWILFLGSEGISGKSDRSPDDVKRYHPPPIQPNGPIGSPGGMGSTGGRRPMMPQFDMDANEIMKVKKLFTSFISVWHSKRNFMYWVSKPRIKLCCFFKYDSNEDIRL